MNKLKLKFLTTLTLIGVIFAACEMNEDVISENHYSNELKIKLYEKKYEQLMTEKKFINSFSKIPKKSPNSILNRTVMEDEYGFTISDKPAKVIEMNGDVSYTFLIERDSIDTTFFENLVVQTDSLDNTEAYIIKYTLTSDYFNTDHNSLDYTSTKEITPIIYNNQNSTSSISNKIIYQETCTVINYITCCQSWGGGPGSCHPAQEVCLTSSAGTQYLSSTSETVCSTAEIDLGDTSGGGSSPSGGGGSGAGGSVNTSPVNNCRDCIPDYALTPCDIIKKLQLDTNFKSRMSGLIDSARNWSFEQCIVLYNSPTPLTSNNFTYQTFSGSIGSPSAQYTGDTTMQGIIHSHYSGLLSIFSGEDIQDLYLKMKNYPSISNDIFIAVVTSSNTAYLLQIPDRAAFIAFGDKYLSTQKDLEKFIEKTMGKKYGLNSSGTNAANELGFLKMLKELNTGLSVSTATFNSSTTASASIFDNWTKIEYNSLTNNTNSSTCN